IKRRDVKATVVKVSGVIAEAAAYDHRTPAVALESVFLGPLNKEFIWLEVCPRDAVDVTRGFAIKLVKPSGHIAPVGVPCGYLASTLTGCFFWICSGRLTQNGIS